MRPARREPGPGERATPDALMDAALALLATRGVLAGLNPREVADAVDEPLPHLDATRAWYRRRIDAGELPGDLDVDAAHLVGLAATIGVAIDADAAARRLGVDADELRARTREVLRRMLEALVGDAAGAGDGKGAGEDEGAGEHGGLARRDPGAVAEPAGLDAPARP